MAVCTLTIKDDFTAEYEDDILHPRSKAKHVTARLGGDPLDRQTIAVLDRLVADYDCTRPVLKLLGRYLYKVAFGDPDDGGDARPLGTAFEETYAAYRQMKTDGTPLTLRLVIEKGATTLGKYPWEFLCMPGEEREVFLVEEGSQLILTRYVPGTEIADRAVPAEGAKLKILIVVSQPGGSGRARVSADDLIERVRKLNSEHIEVSECEEPATRKAVTSVIEKTKPHIVHFIGHGQPGKIAFVKSDSDLRAERARLEAGRLQGEPAPVVDEADWADSVSVSACLLAGLEVGTRPGRIVFLHACHGATGTAPAESLESFGSVARELAYHDNVAGVVAMQYPITNGDAQTFATKFYECIRSGLALEEAVGQARRELGLRATGGRQAWNDRGFGTPVIYVRTNGPVFRADSGPATAAGDAGAVRRLRCPYRCGSLVAAGSGRCPNPACGGQVGPCPTEGCTGLVALVGGGECTSCDFKIPLGDSVARGATAAATGAPEFARGASAAPAPVPMAAVPDVYGKAPDLFGSDVDEPPPDTGNGNGRP